MTRDDIIRMANEAELCHSIWIDEPGDDAFESVIRFGQMIAEAEREMCAKRAAIALLGTLQTTSDRVLVAVRKGDQ